MKQLLAEGKTVIIKEALANGRIFRNKSFQNYKTIYDYLNLLASKYNVGVDAIALRFIIDYLEPNILLSGASNSKQIKQNLKALNFELHKTEIVKLKSFSVSPKSYWQERDNLKWN